MKLFFIVSALVMSLPAFAVELKPTKEAELIQRGEVRGRKATSVVTAYVDKERGVVCYVTMFNSNETTAPPAISCVKM